MVPGSYSMFTTSWSELGFRYLLLKTVSSSRDGPCLLRVQLSGALPSAQNIMAAGNSWLNELADKWEIASIINLSHYLYLIPKASFWIIISYILQTKKLRPPKGLWLCQEYRLSQRAETPSQVQSLVLFQRRSSWHSIKVEWIFNPFFWFVHIILNICLCVNAFIIHKVIKLSSLWLEKCGVLFQTAERKMGMLLEVCIFSFSWL